MNLAIRIYSLRWYSVVTNPLNYRTWCLTLFTVCTIYVKRSQDYIHSHILKCFLLLKFVVCIGIHFGFSVCCYSTRRNWFLWGLAKSLYPIQSLDVDEPHRSVHIYRTPEIASAITSCTVKISFFFLRFFTSFVVFRYYFPTSIFTQPPRIISAFLHVLLYTAVSHNMKNLIDIILAKSFRKLFLNLNYRQHA